MTKCFILLRQCIPARLVARLRSLINSAVENALRTTRTQFAPQDLSAIDSDPSFEKLCIEMSPGDVLLHDVMLAHSFPTLDSQHQREVLYFELRSLSHLQSNPRVSPEWILARQSLKDTAKAAFLRSVMLGTAAAETEDVTEAEWRVIEDVYYLRAIWETARY